MAERFDIERVLDLNKWEILQEKIATATDLAIILVDYRGKPITRHSQVKPFCRLARNHPQLSVYCEKCDARGGVEAVRTGEPFIYRCHFDIIDMAIPIMVDNHYVGAIMAGEIMAEHHQEQLEQVLNLSEREDVRSFKAQHQDLIDAYPRLSLTKLTEVAAMLEQLSEYIVTEAIKKDYLVKAYKQTLRIAKRETDDAYPSTEDTADLEFVREDLRQSLLEKRLTDTGIYQAKNRTLQPAIDAVFANKAAHLDLASLAELVNLSPTYLSRLLREEFGEPFSQIYAKLKIHWAEELLSSTELSIAEISDTLGYLEPSYFIRSFKKIKGTTPLKWRQSLGK
ncbi:PocR ligand-binding domain-containing protein [Candidatus Enterococcus leclercqii]|uniref:PocR ligand-binding domain-containing protein n=1 Tax=Candidatus Enterococcus leclercqii TaxID=1857218 RepID=UPI00137B5B7D|nr:PocR ligand-binding domain-containing protein [Enterococcus sp. CU9D]KAF1293934.1 AraC family transcriptional regulator [Enterococcus sp. CU9D]